MTAIELLCDGTIRAAGRMVKETDRFPKLRAIAGTDRYYDLVAGGLKQTVKAELDNVMVEWKDVVEARMGDTMLRATMNAQCNDLALKGLKMLEEEL